MLGGYGVGKTSLVSQFVQGIFSEKYLITIGVKIDKKTIVVDDREFMLMLWDIAGEEDDFTIPPSYLNGSDGYFLVIDGTRPDSYEQALDIRERSQKILGDIPFVVVLNKVDLKEEWSLGRDVIDEMNRQNWAVIKSSAKLGTGVEEAFHGLVQQMASLM